MSVQAMSWVIENSKHKGSDLLCLLMIANHAHADGTNSFPSIHTLARECRMSDRQIMRIVQRLSKSNPKELRLEKGKGPHGTHLFTVIMSPPDNLSPLTIEAGTGDKMSQGGDIAMSHKPSLEPSVLQPSRDHATKPRRVKTSNTETCPQEWMTRLHLLTGISIDSASPRSRKEIKDCGLALIHSSHTLEQVDLFERNWYADEWRKKNNILPKPRDIQDKFDAIIQNGKGSNHAVTQGHIATSNKPSQQLIETAARINAKRNGTTYDHELSRLQVPSLP